VPRSGNPGTLTEAGRAYDALYDWLAGAYVTTPCAPGWDGTTWTCGFARTFPLSYRSLAVWNTLGPARFAVPEGYTQYRDLDGGRWPVSPGSEITIGIKPILLESFPTTGANRASYQPPSRSSGEGDSMLFRLLPALFHPTMGTASRLLK
jgi:hypothetical protein